MIRSGRARRAVVIGTIALLSLAPSVATGSDTIVELMARADDRALDAHPTWRRLLHFTARGGMSEIADPDFWLSPNGRADAKAELHATIAGWFAEGEGDAHPRCRFPARYAWLAVQLNWSPDSAAVCAAFDGWARMDSVSKVGLLFAALDTGSSSTAFGHVALVFGHSDHGVFPAPDDRVVNFAQYPESAIPNVLTAWFGVVPMQVSAQPNLIGEDIYARTQMRDRWIYPLDLDAFQRLLLLGHVWETSASVFGYVFFSDNCATRLASLLSLVTPEPLDTPGGFVYTPMEFMERVEVARLRGASPFGERAFLPSDRTRLRGILSQLDRDEVRLYTMLLDGSGEDAEVALARLTKDRADLVAGALSLRLQMFDATRDPSEPSAAHASLRRTLLMEQARSGTTAQVLPGPEVPATPLHAHPSHRFSVGSAPGSGPVLGIAAYALELRDDPDLKDETVLFSLVYGPKDRSSGDTMRYLDIIRYRHMGRPHADLIGARAWARSFRLSYRDDDAAGQRPYGEAAFGFGRAPRFSDDTLAYLMVGAAVATGNRAAAVEGNLGLVHRRGPLAVELDFRRRRATEGGDAETMQVARFRWVQGRSLDWVLHASNTGTDTDVVIGFERFW